MEDQRDEDGWTFGDGGFVKIYGDRLAGSSLLDCEVASRWVFVFMLSQSDALGRFRCASVRGLARAANVPYPAAQKAVAELESPDPDSTTKTHEGRRILRIPGGWQLVNYSYYRDFRTKEQMEAAERKRRQREREREQCDMSQDVPGGHSDGPSDVRRKTSETTDLSIKQRAREREISTAPANPIVSGRRDELELEVLRLVREIAELEHKDPETIMRRGAHYEGASRSKMNPAAMSDDRLLNTVEDLREWRRQFPRKEV